MAQRYRILSIDGGGIRGIIPAVILAEIEQRTEPGGTDYGLREIFAEDRYFRLQTSLDYGSDALDDASRDNMRTLLPGCAAASSGYVS